MQLSTQGGCSTLVSLITRAACLRPVAFFHTKTSLKKSQAQYNIKKFLLLPCIVALLIFTMLHSIFAENECEHTHQLFISVQFRSLLMKGKTGKIFI